MSIIDNILSRFGYTNQKQFNTKLSEAIKIEIDKNLPVWLGETADAARWNMPDPSVYANQADLYRLSPNLGTAIDILGSDIGTSRFNVKRMVGEETRDIPNHEFELLLRDPNPLDTGIEITQYTISNYLLNGNSVWWLNRASQDDTPSEIWPIPFSMLKIVPDKYLYIDHYDYFPGAGHAPLRMETWEIVHYKKYNPNNRFVGLSPIESLAMTIQGDLAMRKTNTVNYAEYGGAPQSILAFKDYVENETWKDVKASTREAAKKNQMMMLRGVGDGVTWLQRALSSKDMDFISGLKQNMTDIFNRMCPGLLSMLSESATEANALAARATYAEKTQWPMMEIIAQKITSDILPAYGRKLVGVFDDPRVVDKKLRLDEQTAFERSHTLAEVRKEYYQDDELGDERDDQIIANLHSTSTQPVNNNMNNNEQPPVNVEDNNTDSGDVSAKALIDLDKWYRKSLKRIGKATPFESEYIDTFIAQSINDKLIECKDGAAIKAVFDNAKKLFVKEVITPASNTAILLEGIRLGIKALEIDNVK